MRLLLDSSVWVPTGPALRTAGYDVEWVGDRSSDPGDRAILEYAQAHGRVLVTLDNDVGELAVHQQIRHSGIIRLALTPPLLEADVCLSALHAFGAELVAGANMTATPCRMRLRPANTPLAL